MPSISSSSIIDAPIELVWEVLIDFDNYNKWNEFTPRNTCDGTIGQEFVLDVRMKKDKLRKNQPEKLLELDNESRLVSWGYTMFGLRAKRVQHLKQLDDGRVEYYTSEDFHGITAYLVMLLYRKQLQKGFDLVSKNLKDYCENN